MNRYWVDTGIEQHRRLNVMFSVMSLKLDTNAQPFWDQYELGLWRIHMTNLPTKTERTFGYKVLEELILTAYERQDYRTARWLETTLKFANFSDNSTISTKHIEDDLQKIRHKFQFWGIFGYTFVNVASTEALSKYDVLQRNCMFEEEILRLGISAAVYRQAIQNGNYAVASAAAHVHGLETKIVEGTLVTRDDDCKDCTWDREDCVFEHRERLFSLHNLR
jgi:hypothetical protein